MTIARMIGDGLEKGFVSWWLGVKKTLNITQNLPTTTGCFTGFLKDLEAV